MQDDATRTARRQGWMRTLGAATTTELDTAWRDWHPKPEVQDVRGPEAGLVMVRGRIDAGGGRFNLGEATVTRSTVRLHGTGLSGDLMGSSYLLGTDLEHARLAAVFDGLLTDATLHDRVQTEVVAPLARRQDARDEVRHQEARSTLVDFFTVSREHA
ncbi:phosphonate C-P lyase system protein PhnG [Kineococcus sp. NBC_00420]|uniref:phosphonate C-P lyase system protein PhnG n=1 Tax=unclassified Kineococcus TaxID=2621656 RepID=UPI002E1E8C1E